MDLTEIFYTDIHRELGMVIHAHNPRICVAEAGVSIVQGQPRLHSGIIPKNKGKKKKKLTQRMQRYSKKLSKI